MQSNKSVDCQIDFEILDNLTNHQTRTLIHPSSAARSSFFGEEANWRTRKKFQKLKIPEKILGPGTPKVDSGRNFFLSTENDKRGTENASTTLKTFSVSSPASSQLQSWKRNQFWTLQFISSKFYFLLFANVLNLQRVWGEQKLSLATRERQKKNAS